VGVAHTQAGLETKQQSSLRLTASAWRSSYSRICSADSVSRPPRWRPRRRAWAQLLAEFGERMAAHSMRPSFAELVEVVVVKIIGRGNGHRVLAVSGIALVPAEQQNHLASGVNHEQDPQAPPFDARSSFTLCWREPRDRVQLGRESGRLAADPLVEPHAGAGDRAPVSRLMLAGSSPSCR